MSVVGVVLVGIIAVLIIFIYISEPQETSGEQSIDEMIDYSLETPEVTTDLEDGTFVQVQFQLITDGKKAKEELEKRDFQLTNLLIKEIAVMQKEDFKTGLDDLEGNIQTNLNEIMTEGTVTEVYTIKKILQ